jgi:hypothetical protein
VAVRRHPSWVVAAATAIATFSLGVDVAGLKEEMG